MELVINGETVTVADGLSVADLLKVRNVKMPDMVSVEVNGEILDRKTFDGAALKEGDQVEFMYFMGGGGNFRFSIAARERQRKEE